VATELGKAYVQIIPSAKGIGGEISNALNGEASNAGKSAGFNIASAIKSAIVAAGIGKVIKSSLEAGGNLQQSFGGLETLYGDAAEGAKKYAMEAAKAGISANSYAEQAVSFGAALKQAYGGDTTAAMEAANVAILDMADNSAKMGSDLGSIQAAYQGFARGQYQLLDNLKIGYGGTGAEMERLLSDAEKITGVKYDINNLGDVYKAIHVIQENLDLTGVAADEASTTFSGSLNAMKAAGENLLANLSLGEDIKPSLDVLGEMVNAFIFNNLLPMFGNILKALPDIVSGIAPILIGALNQLSKNAAEIAQTGVSIVTALIEGIVSALPYLVEAALRIAIELGKGLINTDWGKIGNDMLSSLGNSLDLAAMEILGTDGSIIDGIFNGITNALPKILDVAVNIITNLANGLLSALPTVITTAGNILTGLLQFFYQNAPQLLSSGITLLFNLSQGIIQSLPSVIQSAVSVLQGVLSTITSNAPQFLAQGIALIGQIAAGFIRSIPTVVAAIPKIIQSIVNGFGSFDWPSIGVNLIKGIAQGLKDAAGLIVDAAKDAAKSAFNAAKEALGISSPATTGIYVGEMFDLGIAKGISKDRTVVSDAIEGLDQQLINGINTNPSFNFQQSNNDSKIDTLIALLSNYLPQIAEKEGVSMNDLFNGINRQLGWGLQ
jgi:hypothetical protein